MNKKYGLIAIGVVIVILVIALIVAGVTKDNDNKKDPAPVVSDEATLQAQEGNYKLKITKVLEVAPNLFKNAGPSCVAGGCPEGKMTCGKIKEVREFYKEMK